MEPNSLESIQNALESGLEPTREAVEALSGLGGSLLETFQEFWNRLDSQDREALLDAMGNAAEENLVLDFAPIYRLALIDPDDTVRELALRLASEEANPELLDTYLRAAGAEPEMQVRQAAVEELSAFTLTAQVDDWPDEVQTKLERALVGVLHLPGADADLRKAALLSLSYLTTPQTEVEIRQAHLQPDLRDVAIEAMGRNCQEMWIPDIRAELRDSDPRLQITAAKAAAELEDPELVPDLVQLLRDSDEDVKFAAIEALGLIGGEDAKSALTQLLESRNRTLRNAAREALDELTTNEDPFGRAF